ncbi:ABC transporter ATP-binding protein [soil metagenome]
MNSHILSARGVCYGWRGRPVLDGVDLDLRSGELVALLGRNGAGKSTLIRLMMGLERLKEGEIALDGQPISAMNARERARLLAYVPQGHVAPFPYSVRSIVTLGRLPSTGLFGRLTTQDEVAVDEAIALIGIGALAERPYTELSGGERQMVLIARALAQGAGLLILDEPISALDYGNQLRLMARLEVLAASGIGILMTTHHPDHARRVCHRAALLDHGRIIADGHPEDVITANSLAALYDLEDVSTPPAG